MTTPKNNAQTVKKLEIHTNVIFRETHLRIEEIANFYNYY